MNSSLRFAYLYAADGDDFGWLQAELQTPDVSGKAGMWVQWQDLVELSPELRRYPIASDAPVGGDWGYRKGETCTTVVGFSIAPPRQTGGLKCAVRLANPDDDERFCQAWFETDYPALARFAAELEAMMTQRSGEALLTGRVRDG